ncbi:MAG TPA: hypothetical protein VGN59_18165 [Acidimicrobiia bacterium]
MTRRRVVLGALVLGGYLVVLAVTVGLRSDHVRPLYDGFTTPPAYRWVDPPAFFASGNDAPAPVTQAVPLGRDGSEAAGIATPDGQFVLNLGRGAIPTRAGARRVDVTITPVAPGDLTRVPSGLRANGNAYRVVMRYQPGGPAVGALAHPGTVVLEIPELGDHLFTSRLGRSWTEVPATAVPPRDLSLTAPWSKPGYTVGATDLPELVAPSGSSSHSVAIGVGVAVLAVLLLVATFLLVRRRRRSTG